MIELVQTHKFSLVDGKLHRDNISYHLPDTFWEHYDWGNNDKGANFSAWYDDVLVGVNEQIPYWESENDYACQGEWACIGHDGEHYYYKTSYYGSCSGCDWLQSIYGLTDNEDSVEFLNDICHMVKFDTVDELIPFLQKEQINQNFISELLERHIKRLKE